MKFLITNQPIEDKIISLLPYEVKITKIGPWNLILENIADLHTYDSLCSITQGYIRNFAKEADDNRAQEESSIKVIYKNWPPPANITGSFSSLILNKINYEVVACNDIIGIYPLYVLKDAAKLYISNSTILTGIVSAAKLDKTGILQRCVGPEFSNIGSRTILENCKRLLPGQYLRFNHNGLIRENLFDNTLFSNILPVNSSKDIYKEYWDLFKREIEYCLSDTKNVNVALSGGLDSRLVLGAISNEKKIQCITYGGEKTYESKIASRLASKKRAEFRSFSQYEMHFPSSEILNKYVLENESVNLGSWIEILENVEPEEREPLLMGDMAELLNARNIKKYSSKKFRQQNFIDYYLLNKDYQFKKSSLVSFQDWKERIVIHHLRWYTSNALSEFDFDLDKKIIEEELRTDLNEIFSRIEAHNLPYEELYDELFAWYTHSRIPMGKQILICNSKFKSYCPSMSISVMRMGSRIHPGQRLGSRIMDKLFSQTAELQKLQLPTSQSPIIPQHYPNFIKYPVWGLRSKIDNYLISKMVRKKDVTRRYRLFNSMNWAKIYQNPSMEDHLRSYFKNNYLGSTFFNRIFHLAIARKELKQWPFANMDLLNVASLNLEIENIKKNGKS